MAVRRRYEGLDAEGLPRSLRLAKLLDAKFVVPGTTFRFGIDPLIGLIPVAGDAIAFGLGSLIVIDAWRLGVRKRILARMVLNLGVDWLIGSMPVVGDAADFVIKPNRANARLLKRELGIDPTF
ncbi:DUF4112 domain-containing protein [Nodularia spumigena]|uniref:DUF4112 domain-containing protein n=1 Tax=Nodularia spumigena TaxID=70799 RepID=UPI002B204DEA|nr:DUF4112 domain-containing protein [Nodularia spumigena]MEA5614831.1 DUF4112 domain-containing protein [Nodularia spumigena UHCC 0040]